MKLTLHCLFFDKPRVLIIAALKCRPDDIELDSFKQHNKKVTCKIQHPYHVSSAISTTIEVIIFIIYLPYIPYFTVTEHVRSIKY